MTEQGLSPCVIFPPLTKRNKFHITICTTAYMIYILLTGGQQWVVIVLDCASIGKAFFVLLITLASFDESSQNFEMYR